MNHILLQRLTVMLQWQPSYNGICVQVPGILVLSDHTKKADSPINPNFTFQSHSYYTAALTPVTSELLLTTKCTSVLSTNEWASTWRSSSQSLPVVLLVGYWDSNKVCGFNMCVSPIIYFHPTVGLCSVIYISGTIHWDHVVSSCTCSVF